MFDWIRDSISEEAGRRGIDANKLSFFKRVGGDLSSGGKAIFEILGPDHPKPLWVAKAARSPKGSPALKREYQRLVALQERVPSDLANTIPRPIAFVERPTGSISLETALPGEKVSRILREHGQADPWSSWENHCRLALDWYMQFSRQEPRHSRILDESWWQTKIIEPLESCEGFLRDLSPYWGTVSEAIHGAPTLLSNRSYGDILPHGDFTPTNLVIQGESIGVFDWSPEDLELPPACDLFHFMISASLYLGQSLERKIKLGDLSANILLDERFLKPIRPYFREYFNNFSIPADQLYPLFLSAAGGKIVTYANRPEPIRESLCGWIFSVSCWLQGNEKSPHLF